MNDMTPLAVRLTAEHAARMLEEAGAQEVPPHKPGAICQTPRFWCWAQPPGQPGGACTCPSPVGPVRGTLI